MKQLEASKIPLAEMTLGQVLLLLRLLLLSLQALQKLLRRGVTGTEGRAPNSMEEAATNLQMRMEEAVAKRSKLHDLACQAYVSFVRTYAS